MKNNFNLIDETIKRNPLHLLIGGLLVVFGLLALLSGIRNVTDNKSLLYTPNARLNIERAVTLTERKTGLSNRQSLDKNSGMLFVFEESDIHCFWMKDTFIPLDMVWLDSDKKVVYVHENAEVKSEKPICPDKASLYVLEVNAGQSTKLGLAIGTVVKF